jgi:hypothetical protein
MGDDPATSVVDRYGLAHDVPNLAIIDGSVFVTAGCTNPTSTICALALRTAEHLLDRRRDLPRPARRRWYPVPGAPADDARPVPPTPRFTAVERERLAALADVLIPGGDGMPPASEVGVAGELLDTVIRCCPDLVEELEAVLASDGADVPTVLGELDQRPARRVALLTAVAGAYYLSPVVHRALGYPGLVPLPVTPADYPEYVVEGLLDHIVEAGSTLGI